ncbi:hypothetical protein POTOM_040177 [Populus tomentosa]|uniref:Uncharacterized protein n=1 Tax=Populus tomentosa TaxID=118781 RepID=A0A8X7YTZ7_POPTO|nr:hypothetical protein POTOM_040177 [Populus tomentosa]
MGNCLFGGLGVAEGVIKVMTSNGGILEFNTPITAGSITNEFPGHALFPSQDLFWRPLSLQEELQGGQSYYLLPLHNSKIGGQIVREGHVRSKSIPAVAAASNIAAPYRMSLDYQGALKRSYTEVFSRYSNNYDKSNNGFWKVKLVISPEQLVEILSQEARTEELIENVRAVAKCGNGFSSSASSVEFSDSWSLSSSRNASFGRIRASKVKFPGVSLMLAVPVVEPPLLLEPRPVNTGNFLGLLTGHQGLGQFYKEMDGPQI